MKRPLAVTLIGWLYIAAGTVGVVYHAREFKTLHPFPSEAVGVCLVRLLAILCGWFLLRGKNWARWLALAWMAYHVVLSAFHTLSELLFHAVFLAIIAALLFRPRATAYFRNRNDPANSVMQRLD